MSTHPGLLEAIPEPPQPANQPLPSRSLALLTIIIFLAEVISSLMLDLAAPNLSAKYPSENTRFGSPRVLAESLGATWSKLRRRLREPARVMRGGRKSR